jgi:uncharacterized protein (TIGR02594 family)
MKWLEVAFGELADHIAEDPRPGKDNPRIIQYDSATSLKAQTDEVPWCSAFACWCMEQAGIASTRNAMARSWLTWVGGDVIQVPRIGAIAVFARGVPSSNQGHVGFYLAQRSGKVALLAGNQGDAVSVEWARQDHLLGYRWPKGVV